MADYSSLIQLAPVAMQMFGGAGRKQVSTAPLLRREALSDAFAMDLARYGSQLGDRRAPSLSLDMERGMTIPAGTLRQGPNLQALQAALSQPSPGVATGNEDSPWWHDALKGGGLGAAAGSVVPGVGTLLGAGIGAVGGGLGDALGLW